MVKCFIFYMKQWTPKVFRLMCSDDSRCQSQARLQTTKMSSQRGTFTAKAIHRPQWATTQLLIGCYWCFQPWLTVYRWYWLMIGASNQQYPTGDWGLGLLLYRVYRPWLQAWTLNTYWSVGCDRTSSRSKFGCVHRHCPIIFCSISANWEAKPILNNYGSWFNTDYCSIAYSYCCFKINHSDLLLVLNPIWTTSSRISKHSIHWCCPGLRGRPSLRAMTSQLLRCAGASLIGAAQWSAATWPTMVSVGGHRAGNEPYI